jgi:uncharacterized membrane protein YkvA (DUF1232 family)
VSPPSHLHPHSKDVPAQPPALRPGGLRGRRRRRFPLADTVVAAWRFFADPSASPAAKLLFVLALLYIVFPVDAIPDVVPVLGWLDDAGLAALAAAMLLRSIRPYRDAAGPQAAPGAAVVDTTGVEVH